MNIVFAHCAYSFDDRLLKSKDYRIIIKTVKEVDNIPQGTQFVAEIIPKIEGLSLRVVYDGMYYKISPYLCDFIGFPV